MDRENDTAARRTGPDQPPITPDRNVRLIRLRTEQMRRRLDYLNAWGRNASRQLAVRLGGQVPRDRSHTDCFSLTAREDRHDLAWFAEHGGFLVLVHAESEVPE
ncbi:hypothetical protein [Streptomyces sp. SGAir0957]